jgi:hypothetical protein
MQDNWNPTPYRVVHRFKDNVYGIQLADGSGPIRNVTRREICDRRRPDLVQNEPDPEITEDSNLSFGGRNVTYTDPHPIQLEQQESDSTVEDVTPSSSVDETPPVNTDSSARKSKRINAGKHSNPFNLPKSVAVNKADVRENLDEVKFDQVGEAIAALGTSLGQSLGQTLQEGWLKHNISNN